MKFYAHQGRSTDNALTTIDGAPVRTFLAFDSKAARDAAREKIWADSDGTENLINCTRKTVEAYFGRDFVTVDNKMFEGEQVMSMYRYEQEAAFK